VQQGEPSMSVPGVTRGEELLHWIDAQPRALGQAWLAGLENRKREEAEFHDLDRAGRRDEDPESTPNRRFYEAAEIVKSALADRLASLVPGAIFLDYACGNGSQTIAAARDGAAVALGIDISETSIRNATDAAAEAGVANVARFLQRDCEETGLPDGAFDLCLCSGMLHHLDLSRAFPELCRIMAPGGRIVCLEALAYNPFIQLYRNLTPTLRTEWERRHILGLREVHYGRQWFAVENMRFFLLTAPLATLLPSGPLRRAGLRVAHAIDAVATRAPFLKYWSWMFTFELVKVR
jgi:SAM-dependent methyltransferase